jgi:N-acetylglucosamine-6-sulfatase
MKRGLLIIAITAVLIAPLAASAAVRLVRLTSPVSPGDSVTLSVRVSPSSVTCSVTVLYRGRPVRSAALKPKRASGGRVTWTWRLGKLTAPGRWPISVRCGAAGSIKTSVVVRVRQVPKEPPNIVVVIADDQAALDGRLIKQMPTVNSVFGEHGITFSDFHGESPLCCPGRVGFLTGQHTTNHGVSLNLASLFNPRMSLATQLNRVGYHTMLVGKYLNGYGAKRCKTDNCAPHVPAGWNRWAAFSDPAYYNYSLYMDGASVATRYGMAPADYSTDVLGRQAVQMIGQAPADKPIFAWIAPNAPHSPTTVAPRYLGTACSPGYWKPASWNEADVSDKPMWVQKQPLRASKIGTNLTTPCRQLRSVDDLVKTVRDALAARGRLDNTLFIYTSDNGMNEGEHRLGGKGAPYQTQIPFLISWPARLGTSPRTISERLENIDLAPTLCELAGCTMGPYPNGQVRPDGVSFAALLFNSSASIERPFVLEDMPAGGSGAPPWFAVASTRFSSLASTGCDAASSHGCRWHYVEYPKTGEKELYDVSHGPCWAWSVGRPGDPCELQNLAGNPGYASLISRLHDELARLKREKGASIGAER